VPRLLITFFGLGFLPLAPGTWGSLGAVVLWAGLWLACSILGVPWVGFDSLVVLLVLLTCAGTVRWGPWAANTFGRPDPPQCVSDEVAGQWLALLFLPVGTFPNMCVVAGVQLVLFRCFDIVKPPPARQLERLPGGWGILMDDLAAALLANLLGQILFRWLWPLGR